MVSSEVSVDTVLQHTWRYSRCPINPYRYNGVRPTLQNEEQNILVHALEDLRFRQKCCEVQVFWDTIPCLLATTWAIPWLRPLVASPSPRKPGFDPRPVSVEKCGEQTGRGTGFSLKIRTAIFPSPSSHQCSIFIHSHTSSPTLSQEQNKIKNTGKRYRRFGCDSCVLRYCSLRSMEKSTLLRLTWR
jgi:hypothetical protein